MHVGTNGGDEQIDDHPPVVWYHLHLHSPYTLLLLRDNVLKKTSHGYLKAWPVDQPRIFN